MLIRKPFLLLIFNMFIKVSISFDLFYKTINTTDKYPNKLHYVVIKENFGETEFVHYSHTVDENHVGNVRSPVGKVGNPADPFTGRTETIMLKKSIIGPLHSRNASLKDHITKFFSNTNKNIFALPSKIKKQAEKTISKVQIPGIKNNKTVKFETGLEVNFDFLDDTSKKITKNIMNFVNKFGWSKTSEKDDEKMNSKPINITIKGTTNHKNMTKEQIKRFQLNMKHKMGLNNTTGEDNELLLKLISNCSCGAPSVRKLIGGYQTTISRFPWNVRIFFKKYDNDLCGGTIINHKYILTAAHCVMFTNPQELAVRVGHTDLDDPGKVADVKKVIIHSRYSVNKMGVFDIALLQLKKNLNFTDKIMPICLTNVTNFNNKRGIITSWGPISKARNATDILRKAFVRILENKICRRKSDYNFEDLHPSVVCAGITEESCEGDSGGPLVHFDSKKYILVGVKSWNIGCAQQRYPVIYTKVSVYYNWIKQKTKDSTYCLN